MQLYENVFANEACPAAFEITAVIQTVFKLNRQLFK
jgi:hypothetical protein